MPALSPQRHFVWDAVGNVTVIRFTIKSIREIEDILNIFQEVNRLIEEDARHNLILDFSGVQDIASYAIGKLVTLLKKIESLNGRLVLCNLTPIVEEILTIMALTKRFHISRTQEDALQTF